jgi:hypothetical protein
MGSASNVIALPVATAAGAEPVRFRNRDLKSCLFPECENIPRAKGLCSAHRQQQHSGRELVPVKYARAHNNRPVCSACADPDKPKTDEFFHRLRTRNGFKAKCKDCTAAGKSTPEQRAKSRNDWLKRKYGVTEDWYRAQLIAQEGRCAICRGYDPGKGMSGRFSVDHDHKTGAVRALLCNKCNAGIGDFNDSPALLLLAADYLREHAK